MESSPPLPDHRETLLTLRRLVQVRWGLLAVALAAVALAPWLLTIPLPLAPLLLLLALGLTWNGLVQWRLRGAVGAAPQLLWLHLSIDLCLLAALLFFSGGATNPLVSLLLFPVAVAALALPAHAVAAVVGLAVAGYSALMVWFVPLPLADAARAAQLHLSGMWLTFVASALVIAWLVARMTGSIRERDRELARAREQALRDERVIALGALAAGAAHELGTPLGTLTLLAGEFEHEAGLSAAGREDLATMRAQLAHCKEIISRLAEQAGAGRLESAAAEPADAWLQRLFERWRALRPEAGASLKLGAGEAAPRVLVDPTVEQGIVNLLNNAARAGGPVELAADWNDDELRVVIRDQGPGFPDHVLRRAGREAFPPHERGSGIGLLLTFAAVERLGGHIRLRNQSPRGAAAELVVPLASLAQ